MKKTLVILFFCLASLSIVDGKTFYVNGNTSEKNISLTFDDGPGNGTKKILAILKEKKVKATFFMTGINVLNRPELAKMVLDDGHEIANHTYGHINFYKYDNETKKIKIEQEILKTESIIENTLGVKTFFVRFPYGYSKQDAIEVADKLGYYVINWSFGIDWNNMSVNEMYLAYKSEISNGAVFLMHDLSKNIKILSFLGKFIDDIKNEGYEIVTISQLLGIVSSKDKMLKGEI